MTSFADVKEAARDLLPSSSVLRRLILEERDDLPLEEGRPKCELFVKLLYDEVKQLGK